MKFLIPVLFSMGTIIIISFQWAIQANIRQGSGGPIYRNLMDGSAYIRWGFDPADILKMPELADDNAHWVLLESPPYTIARSNLPDLPKRRVLSPFGKPDEEFTIIIPIEMDSKDIAFMENNSSFVPGIYFAWLGENWQIFLNGHLVRSELYLDEAGQIMYGRAYRNVHFPLDKNLFVFGTNVLAIRIIGDPTYDYTGLYYNIPYYVDDYQVILRNHQGYFQYFFSGIFAFTGIYYLFFFFFVRKKEELYNLYYGIFSIGMSVHYFMQNDTVNYLIPNSDIGIVVEFGALFLTSAIIFVFIERMGRYKVSKVSWVFLGIALYFSITQIFFCKQYAEEALRIFLVAWLFYFPFVLFNILYYYIHEKRKSRRSVDVFFSLFAGSVIIYICGILDIIFFRTYFWIVHYSTLVFHIGMAFILSNRFSGMYKRLEYSNVMLEETVKERTIELEKQTEIAIHAARSKTKFLATMSHEIKTPLTVISVHVQQAKELLKPEYSDYDTIFNSLKRAQDETMRTARITENAIRLSSMQESKSSMKYLDMNSLLTNSAEAYRPILEKKGNCLDVSIAGNLPPVYGNADLLIQVMMNLLSNANAHTKGGKIIVSGLYEERYIKVMIADNGEGIEPFLLPNIFERRGPGARNEVYSTGIGLSICKEIIESHNGTIEIKSFPKEGTKVFFMIPVQAAAGENV